MIAMLFVGALFRANAGYAIDSYRYLHVSIETPWMIFLFLLVAVLVPFILIIALMWHGHLRKSLDKSTAKSRDDEA